MASKTVIILLLVAIVCYSMPVCDENEILDMKIGALYLRSSDSPNAGGVIAAHLELRGINVDRVSPQNGEYTFSLMRGSLPQYSVIVMDEWAIPLSDEQRNEIVSYISNTEARLVLAQSDAVVCQSEVASIGAVVPTGEVQLTSEGRKYSTGWDHFTLDYDVEWDGSVILDDGAHDITALVRIKSGDLAHVGMGTSGLDAVMGVGGPAHRVLHVFVPGYALQVHESFFGMIAARWAANGIALNTVEGQCGAVTAVGSWCGETLVGVDVVAAAPCTVEVTGITHQGKKKQLAVEAFSTVHIDLERGERVSPAVLTQLGVSGNFDDSPAVGQWIMVAVYHQDEMRNAVAEASVPEVSVLVVPATAGAAHPAVTTVAGDGRLESRFRLAEPGLYEVAVLDGAGKELWQYTVEVEGLPDAGEQLAYEEREFSASVFSSTERETQCVNTDMKILVISPTGRTDDDPMYRAATEFLAARGVPYDTYILLDSDYNAISDDPLPLEVDGRGLYYGIIVTNVFLAYREPGEYSDDSEGWESAITSKQWDGLMSYEERYRVRHVALSSGRMRGSTPGVEYIEHSYSEFAVKSEDSTIDLYGGSEAVVDMEGEYCVPVTITDASYAESFMQFTSLDGSEDRGVAAAVIEYPDAFQHLILFFNNGPWMKVTQTFWSVWLRWLTDGVYLALYEADEPCDGLTGSIATRCAGPTVVSVTTTSKTESCMISVYGIDSDIEDSVLVELNEGEHDTKTLYLSRCDSWRYLAPSADSCGVCGGSDECTCDGWLFDDQNAGLVPVSGCNEEYHDVGSSCTFECEEGWTDLGGSGTVTCGSRGEYSDINKVCQAPTCDGLRVSTPTGTYISDGCVTDSDALRSKCVLECMEGYVPIEEEMEDPETIKCTVSGYEAPALECTSDDPTRAASLTTIVSVFMIPAGAAVVLGAGVVTVKLVRKRKARRASERGEGGEDGEREMSEMDSVEQ